VDSESAQGQVDLVNKSRNRDGVDAVARLRREHEILVRLAGIPGIPAVYDLFGVWEHHFLAMQHMPGVSLGSWLARNYPLTRRDSTAQDLVDYTASALTLLSKVERIIAAVHERGVVFGDLHALNVLVDTDEETGEDTVGLIDFEMASPIDSRTKPALGAPGFRAPAGRGGFDIDEHALAALRLWIFLPLNTLLELAPNKLVKLAEFVRRRFDLPESFVASILGHLATRDEDKLSAPASTPLDQSEPDWTLVRKSIAEAILASATPERHRRPRDRARAPAVAAADHAGAGALVRGTPDGGARLAGARTAGKRHRRQRRVRWSSSPTASPRNLASAQGAL
jgi:serine/threonine protein kinase